MIQEDPKTNNPNLDACRQGGQSHYPDSGDCGISREAIETAYCFMHQKLRVYEYSNMEWQRDDIEYAISQYVEQMPKALYQALAQGKRDYLLDHRTFETDMRSGVAILEQELGI